MMKIRLDQLKKSWARGLMLGLFVVSFAVSFGLSVGPSTVLAQTAPPVLPPADDGSTTPTGATNGQLGGSDFTDRSLINPDDATIGQETNNNGNELISCGPTRDVKRKRETEGAVSDPRDTKKIADNFLLNAFTYDSLHERLRCDPLIVGVIDATGKPTTTSVYRVAQNLVNLGVLVALLIIGFANILRIKLDTYAVKKSVPLLILGVTLANLSLPIIRTIVDFSGVLTATFIGGSSSLGTREAFVHELIRTVYIGGAQQLGTVIGAIDGGSAGLGQFLAMFGFAGLAATALGPFLVIIIVGTIFLMLVPAILFFTLGLLFVARIYVLVLLAAVSPVAFASLGIEPLKAKIWGWWWQRFIQWTFMAPVTFFLIWLAVRFFQAVGSQPDIGTYIVSVTMIVLAVQLPLKMGGNIMSQWNDKFVKPLGGLALKPFTSARDYVQKGIPRDTSRFASSKGLNVVKSVREFGSAREKYLAEQEARSRSARWGKYYGDLANTVKLQKGPFRLQSYREMMAQIQDFKKNRYNTDEGEARLRALAAELAIEAGVRPTSKEESWEKVSTDKRRLERYNQATEEWANSNDPDRQAAVALINAAMGRFQGEKGKEEVDDASGIFKRLQDRGLDTAHVEAMAAELLGRKIGDGSVQLTLPTDNAVLQQADGDTKKADRLMVEEMGKAVDMAVNNGPETERKKRREALLQSIAKILSQAEIDLTNLQELQKHPRYEGLVRAFVKLKKDAIAEDPTSATVLGGEAYKVKRNGVVLTDLEDQYKYSFGLANAGEIFEAEKAALARSGSLDHLEPLLQTQKMSKSQQREILKDLDTHLQEMVHSLETFLDKRLTEQGLSDDQRREIIRNVIVKDDADQYQLPHDLDPADIRRITGKVDDEIDKIMSSIEGYNIAASRIDEMMSGGKATEEVAYRVSTGVTRT